MTCSSGACLKRGAGRFGSAIHRPVPPGNADTSPSSCWTRSAVLARAGPRPSVLTMSEAMTTPSATDRITEWSRRPRHGVSAFNSLLTRGIVPQPKHLAVASGCLVFEAQEVEKPVGRQERDLRSERAAPPAGLPRGLTGADRDLSKLERPRGTLAQEADRHLAPQAGREGLAEREHVGSPVDLAKPAVQRPHLEIGNEGEMHARRGAYPVWACRTPHRGADRREVAGRLARDGDAHPRAISPGRRRRA